MISKGQRVCHWVTGVFFMAIINGTLHLVTAVLAVVGCSLVGAFVPFQSSVYQDWMRKLRGLWFVTKCRGGGDAWDLRVPIPVLGSSLTLNVDMAGSLLYLSMVWNLDEWLSSWYSSECLLRVCITFWKGRKEGTAKMKSTETNQNKK